MANIVLKLDKQSTEYSCLRSVILDLYNDYVVSSGGYIVQGNYYKQPFNRIELFVTVPGLVRIGIIEDTHIVYWLVQDFVAYTGLHEWDIPDTVITNKNHKLFVESRMGESGVYSNTTEEDLIVNNVVYKPGAMTGAFATRTLDSQNNNEIFKSQNIKTASARFTCVNGEINIGLYKVCRKGDKFYNKPLENMIQWSKTYDEMSDSVSLLVPPLQNTLIGKKIYAIKLDVAQRGELLLLKCDSNYNILDQYRIFIRAIGLQTIVLEKDIVLKEGECLALTSVSEDGCSFYYGDIPEWQSIPMNSVKGFKQVNLNNFEDKEVVDKVDRKEYLNVCFIERGNKRSNLEGLRLSVTGDSITSYKGFITQKDDIPNGNIYRNNFYFYPNAAHGLVNNIDAMWWGVLAKNCRMRILRNDAWSGSKVSGNDLTALSSDIRINMLSAEDTGRNTVPAGNPDIIVSMIGTNDLSSNVELEEILEAFRKYCKGIQKYNCIVCHFLIHRGTNEQYVNAIGITMSELKEDFRIIAEEYGQHFIPDFYFEKLNYKNVNTCYNLIGSWTKDTYDITGETDSIHPNAQGMYLIARGVRKYLEEICSGQKEN